MRRSIHVAGNGRGGTAVRRSLRRPIRGQPVDRKRSSRRSRCRRRPGIRSKARRARDGSCSVAGRTATCSIGTLIAGEHGERQHHRPRQRAREPGGDRARVGRERSGELQRHRVGDGRGALRHRRGAVDERERGERAGRHAARRLCRCRKSACARGARRGAVGHAQSAGDVRQHERRDLYRRTPIP